MFDNKTLRRTDRFLRENGGIIVLFIPWPDFVELALFNICSSPINDRAGRWRREENPIWVEAKSVPYLR
jgi:hypothetical protein